MVWRKNRGEGLACKKKGGFVWAREKREKEGSTCLRKKGVRFHDTAPSFLAFDQEEVASHPLDLSISRVFMSWNYKS